VGKVTEKQVADIAQAEDADLNAPPSTLPSRALKEPRGAWAST